MKFTFGFITTNTSNLIESINSIIDLQIPQTDFEVIIVGGTNIFTHLSFITHIPFDETIKNAWITKKKNIIIENAKYENIVMCHDYIKFDINWYSSFLTFGNDWDICVTKIVNKNGRRFRDFTFFPGYDWYSDIKDIIKERCLLPNDSKPTKECLRYMYISGSYFIVKKYVVEKYKLDERLSWGESEDVEWYKRVLKEYTDIKYNYNSIVHFTKIKDQCHWEEECGENNFSKVELYIKNKNN
jgi:hypothetical protein